jgi:hypothetical protein
LCSGNHQSPGPGSEAWCQPKRSGHWYRLPTSCVHVRFKVPKIALFERYLPCQMRRAKLFQVEPRARHGRVQLEHFLPDGGTVGGTDSVYAHAAVLLPPYVPSHLHFVVSSQEKPAHGCLCYVAADSFTSFGFEWPPLLTKLFNVASMSSFNKQFLAPECSIGGWGFQSK